MGFVAQNSDDNLTKSNKISLFSLGKQHQTTIATFLRTNKPNQLCIVTDATYLFIQV